MTPVRSPQAYGRVVRTARRQAGLTQAELATRSLTNRQTIIGLESGHETRAIVTLFDTLAALNLEFAIRPRAARGRPAEADR
jgi:HTH-type transcriptional regulator/antitoxin HipB